MDPDGAQQRPAPELHTGSYTTAVEQATFARPEENSALTFAFTIDDGGALAMTQIGSLRDVSITFVWITRPWQKIG